MSTELEVRIGNDYAELSRLTAAVEAFLDHHSIPTDVSYKAHLALEEMCTNVIKYGYDDKGAHEILVHLRCDPGVLSILIEDDGHEFDPLSAPEPDTSAPLAERPIGGLGLHLVRKSVSAMRYTRDHSRGRNVLEMALRF